MMVPRSYYSFAITFSLFTLLWTNYTERTTWTLPAQQKSNALNQLRTLLGSVGDQIDIQDANFEVVNNEQKGVEVSGVAYVFGVRNVNVHAVFGNNLTEITTSFPGGTARQIRLSGQTLSDWFPAFLRDKLDLTEVQMQFYPKENNRLVLAATLRVPSRNALIEYNGFKIEQPTLTFKLNRSGGTTPVTSASAELAGTFQLGTLNFTLAAAANSQREWRFVGVLNELKVADLVRNIASYLNITMPPLPGTMENFKIQQASLALNSDRSLRFKGDVDLWKVEAYFAKPSGQPADFLLGFAPNTNNRLARISNVLQPIDKIGLDGIAIIYSATTEKIDQELDLLIDLQLGTQTVKPGLTLLGGFDIPDNLPGMTNKGRVTMRTNLPPSLTATPTLQAVMQFNGLQLGNDFKINESFLELNPVDVSFAAGLSIGAKLDGNWLNFTGKGEVAAPGTFGLVIYMEQGSVWNEPFGVKGVAIADLGLDVGADILSPIPRPKLGVSGALKVGPFQGSGAGMLDTGNPLNSLISLKMNQIGMQQFIDAFLSGTVKKELNKLPAQLRDFGVKDAELTIIRKTTEMAGRTYTQGLRVAGKVNLVGLGARMDVNASFDAGYSGVAAVSPFIIKEGNLTIFELTGNHAADSARMAIDMTYNNFTQLQNPFLLIDGKVGLLGMSNQTKVEVNKDGVYFYNKGKIFDKFYAELDGKGGNFNDVKGFAIRAAMQNDFTEYLNNGAANAIDAATKDMQNRYRKAKEDIAEAEKYLRETQADVDAFNNHKKKVDDKIQEVEKLNREAEDAKDDCEKGNPIACGEYGTKKAAYEIAKGVLQGYQETLSGLRDAVDWSKRNIAAEVVRASGEIVKGFEEASNGTMKAAKWIVDKGLGGVVDVKSAEFAGKLDVLKGGMVNMKVNASFVNEPFNAQIAFNFTDPASGAKILGEMLVKELAPKGFAPTFGAEIKPRVYNTTLIGNK
ncbi:MAG: hypothetical protein ACK4TA_03035 [Saprospiraceae bacterium]